MPCLVLGPPPEARSLWAQNSEPRRPQVSHLAPRWPCVSAGWLSPDLGGFTTHATPTVLDTRGDPPQICSFLCAQASPPWLLLWDSNCLRFPGLSPVHCRESSRSAWLPLAAQTLQAVSSGNCRAHPICFSSPGDHYISLPDVYCLENQCPIYFVCLVAIIVSDGRVTWSLLLHLGQKQKSAICLWI